MIKTKLKHHALLTLPALLAASFFNLLHASDLNSVRGVIKASNEAVVAVEFSSRVIETPVDSGDSFSKGDVLLKFDCEAMKAEQTAAKAAYQAARITHKNNLELQSYRAIGDIEVSVSKAQMSEAKARADVIAVRLKDCVIIAPYNGKVAELAINNFEIPAANQPLLKIVGNEELELKLIIPSSWLSRVEVGHEFWFSVDETGSKHSVAISRIGAYRCAIY